MGNFFENRGKSETGGENASWPQRGWTPLRAGKGKEKDRPLPTKFEHPQLKFLVAPLVCTVHKWPA